MITNSSIAKFLQEELPKLHIVVLGDIMVDRYIFGEVSRISPEAPVPVNRVERESAVLGGAANVAANLAHLDCKVSICGLIGNDNNAQLLKNMLAEANINAEGLVLDEKRETTTKIRILDNRQQMLRLDFETVCPIANEHEEQVVAYLEEQCQQGVNGIVISDYGKGFFTKSLTERVIALAKKYNVMTIVDPKGTDWQKYNGATFITPNVKELREFLGENVQNEDDAIVRGAKTCKEKCDIEYIVVTRSAKGITLTDGVGVWHNPAIQQNVYDVSGAGDTVVAMLITSMAAGLSNRMALTICNVAASIVVSKVGTYPIHRQELLEYWQKYLERAKEKQRKRVRTLNSEDTILTIKKWKENGQSIVFTNGCFDILHRGHIEYLKETSKLGDRFVIGLNSDRSVKALKGESRPINNEADRKLMLESLYFVDAVVIFDEDTPYELLKQIEPQTLVKGGDYVAEEVVGYDIVDKVVIMPFVAGYSTTNVIKKIEANTKECK